MTIRRLWGIIGVMAAAACSGSAIEVGPGSGGAPGSNGSGSSSAAGSANPGEGTCTDISPLPQWPSATDCVGTNDLALVGKWHGYIENEDPPWDELFLDIKGANSSGLCGTLAVGSATPPAPATDPTHGYPPGVSNFLGWQLIPGYPMTLLGGTTDGARIRFRVAPTEGYKSWCKLQTPYGHGDGLGCGCVPSGPSMGGPSGCVITDQLTQVTRTFDCDQAGLCDPLGNGSPVCACNASGCDAVDLDLSAGRFDMVVRGDTIEGSETGHPTVRVHFTRVP